VIKTQPYTTTIPRSQRGGEIVEPMISTQWFVRIEPLAKAALEAVQDGKIRIVPERFEKVYFNWLENIKDWCISRQLWWGHRIPVWYCPDGHMTTGREDPSKCGACGSGDLTQDPDVLDTWFSSGLWPFSTLGWPEETGDLKYFYPTSFMETGYDILFFWVARMIMMGLEFTGQAPFHTVYLHGLIRDEHGRKMSKTYGNVIDPLTVMDELGTDALRFTLLVGSAPGNDTNLSVKKVEANRNFANKMWNAGRFVIRTINSIEPSQGFAETDLADDNILEKLGNLVRDTERLFQAFQYGEAGRQIYDFFWSDFADWHIEAAKQQISKGGDYAARAASTLTQVLDTCLRLLHPFTPFVTEEVWGHLRRALLDSPLREIAEGWPEALIVAPWPDPTPIPASSDATKLFSVVVEDPVQTVRNYRAEYNINPNEKLGSPVIASGPYYDELLKQAQLIGALAGTAVPEIVRYLDRKPENSTAFVTGTGIVINIPTKGAGRDYAAEERARLEKGMVEVESQIKRLEELLAGEFGTKAPAPVIARERERLATLKETAEKLKAQLKG